MLIIDFPAFTRDMIDSQLCTTREKSFNTLRDFILQCQWFTLSWTWGTFSYPLRE